MNITGMQFVAALCRRLEDLGELKHDSNIINLLRTLDKYELNQLLTFGDVDKWICFRNNQNIK